MVKSVVESSEKISCLCIEKCTFQPYNIKSYTFAKRLLTKRNKFLFRVRVAYLHIFFWQFSINLMNNTSIKTIVNWNLSALFWMWHSININQLLSNQSNTILWNRAKQCRWNSLNSSIIVHKTKKNNSNWREAAKQHIATRCRNPMV